MKLIVSNLICAEEKAIADLLKSFCDSGNLVILSGDSKVDSEFKAASSINSLDEIDPTSVYLLMLPIDDLARTSLPENCFPILLRKDLDEIEDSSRFIKVSDYGQIKSLINLESYPGLSRLFSLRKSSVRDFEEIILANYASAINQLMKDKHAIVFGAQRLGELVFEGLNTLGVMVNSFVDNGVSKHGTLIRGLAVDPLSAISDKDLPVVIATTRFTYSISKQLREQGFHNVIPYAVLTLIDPELFPDEIPYIGIQQDFSKNALRYIELFVNLVDGRSKEVLDALVTYRLDYDADYAFKVFDGYGQHYFDPEIANFGDNEVFVDLGGYDGDTVENYINFSKGKYKKIYMFEPDSKLLAAAQQRLIGKQNVEFVPAGAYSLDGELRFSASGRTNGSFSDDGELVIPVKKIDSVVKIPPTFIKMDIEGSETEALKGAAKWIAQVKPNLAIAAYHKAQDLWDLVNVIRELNDGYEFYLRHYSETGLETVIYAVDSRKSS